MHAHIMPYINTMILSSLSRSLCNQGVSLLNSLYCRMHISSWLYSNTNPIILSKVSFLFSPCSLTTRHVYSFAPPRWKQNNTQTMWRLKKEEEMEENDEDPVVPLISLKHCSSLARSLFAFVLIELNSLEWVINIRSIQRSKSIYILTVLPLWIWKLALLPSQ